MNSRTVFHLDCTPVLAECGCQCGRCLAEMKSVFGGTRGVGTFYSEGDGVVVEHDPGIVTVDALLDIFRRLPSFYQKHFIPSVMANPGRQD